MRALINNIKNCSLYFVATGAVFLCLTVIILCWTKSESHLFVNQFHNSFLDNFFSAITYAGSGISAGFTIIILLFVKYRHAIALGVGYVASIGIVQLFKHVILSNMHRPVRYFEDLGIDIYTVSGVEQKTLKGFPSGHTTEIFCVVTYLALISKHKLLQIALLCIGLIVAYSRVYLSQHFIQDILGGAVLGTFCALVTYTAFQRYQNTNNKLEKSILNR